MIETLGGSNPDPLLTAHYAEHPYPPYDPGDEAKRLCPTPLDQLDTLSDRCFGGKLNPSNGMRVLVAGGGTGGDALFLAEQLRDTPSEVVYVDLSRASMELAQQGAEARGLSNITWINGSLLDLPDTIKEPFDYINCCGVLHHLEDPQAGLQALEAVLGPDGAMGLLVYAPYGHRERYRLRDVLRISSPASTSSIEERLINAHALVAGMLAEWQANPDSQYITQEARSNPSPAVPRP